MTELSMLYGGFDEVQEARPRDDNKISAGQQIHQLASQGAQPPMQVQQLQQAPQVQQIQEPIQSMQIQQPVYQQNQAYQQNQQAYRRRPNEYSFWDRMNIKRPEVIKLAVFSLVIVFAIAIDRMGTHYISKYISENVLTDTQEFLLRLSYPIIIFLVLWIAKSW